MTCTEFLSSIKSHNAHIAPAPDSSSIILANTNLQNMHAAILPNFIIELYSHCGAITLDSGYIFGPTEISRDKDYPIPDIVSINHELIGIPQIQNKTVFGQNDLFWFAFDAFGKCEMLDNISLTVMRKYDDAWRAMYDCLIAGKL